MFSGCEGGVGDPLVEGALEFSPWTPERRLCGEGRGRARRWTVSAPMSDDALVRVGHYVRGGSPNRSSIQGPW